MNKLIKQVSEANNSMGKYGNYINPETAETWNTDELYVLFEVVTLREHNRVDVVAVSTMYSPKKFIGLLSNIIHQNIIHILIFSMVVTILIYQEMIYKHWRKNTNGNFIILLFTTSFLWRVGSINYITSLSISTMGG
jgi:hypothetical protein